MSFLDSSNDEQFTLVTSKKRNKKRPQVKINIKNHLLNIQDDEIDQVDAIKKINEACIELKRSNFHKTILQTLIEIPSKVIDRLICFGIGKIGNCSISQHQLALILLLRTDLNINFIEFHEPLLSTAEKSVLKHFHCSVFEGNVEGKLLIESVNSTIVYLPHCPKQLTNNLLWKNWNTNLSNLIFICNSTKTLIESTPVRFLQDDALYLLKIADYIEEIPLPSTYTRPNTFNDTSVHFFRTERLPKDFWIDNFEPNYSANSSELITVDLLEKLKL